MLKNLATRIKAIRGVETVILALYQGSRSIEYTNEMNIESAIRYLADHVGTSKSFQWRLYANQWWDAGGMDWRYSREVANLTEEIYNLASMKELI